VLDLSDEGIARLYNREYDRRWAENGHDASEARVYATGLILSRYAAEAWREGAWTVYADFYDADRYPVEDHYGDDRNPYLAASKGSQP